MRYFRPRSLTWWAGLAAVALGSASLAAPHYALTEMGRVVAALVGSADASPAGLILGGLGLIGLRDKLERR